MHFYGDMIYPDVDPIVLASTHGSDELVAGLNELADIAREIGVEQVWEKAELLGLDQSHFEQGPPRTGQPGGVLGVSLAWAPLPGIGFCRNDEFVAEVPRIDAAMSPFQQAVLRKKEPRYREEASIRGPQVQAVRRLVEAAKDRLPFPVAAAIGFDSSWVHDFCASYLRRLAYALAFEASLRARSLEPYEALYPVLVTGSVEELGRALPPLDAPYSFSLRLNLLAVLHAIAGHERNHPEPAPTLSSRMVEGAAKRTLLEDGIEDAAEMRGRSLHDEGRLVLQKLLEELRRAAKASTWCGLPHDWGRTRVPDPGTRYFDE